MKRCLSFVYMLFIVLGAVCAQELNCRVEVNTSQLEGTNKSVFETLQGAINEYVNTTRWTNAQFSPNEKIDCTLFFNITKYDESTGRMEGSLQVQSKDLYIIRHIRPPLLILRITKSISPIWRTNLWSILKQIWKIS